MKLRDSIVVAANVQKVWPLVADPVLQADWNRKIVSIDRTRSGLAKFGDRFEMIYRMSGRDRESNVEVIALEPSQRIVFRHQMTWKSRQQFVEEEYRLEPCAGGVRVTQIIDLGRAGIPWPFRALIWFIAHFGHSTEPSYLSRLRELAEGTANSAQA
jgi:uncharacterized protein YndB with AHSA1/START domain